MGRNRETSTAVDGLLRVLIAGGIVGTIVIAPNAVRALDKSLQKIFKKLDKRERERELKRLTTYMRTQGLVRGSYEHGLSITRVGRRRAERFNINDLAVPFPKKWDKKWRLLLFDIPESKRDARTAFTGRLKLLGFQILQQSVWIHPFPCREQVQVLCARYEINEWVSYIETSHIDHEENLVKRFKEKYVLK